jgi:3-oxoacyl-[acyl-carrier-protein] synthase II
MARPRIAVTGLGVICSIGGNTEEFLAGLRAGRSGISKVEHLDTLWTECKIGGEIKDYTPPDIADAKIRLSRADQFAVTATIEALADAELADGAARAEFLIGSSIGTCQNALSEADDVEHTDDRLLAGSPADAVAVVFGLEGPRIVATNACAAGGSAITMARDQLWDGTADIMLAGGSDGLAFFTYAGFSVLHSLDLEPCSPYGRSSGLTLGEGAAVFVLETFEHAEARGVEIIAELAGCGGSADGYHPTAPDPTGRGAVFAMRRALRQGGLDPADVDYVNGHGTGTSANDAMERAAFQLVFGDRAHSVPISSTKSMIGHTLGAAGAIEAAACVLAIRHGFLPPTINLPSVDPDDFDFVGDPGRAATVNIAVSNNYAFGGSNASLVWANPARIASPPAEENHQVLVTGLGAVGGLGEGLDAWVDTFDAGVSPIRMLDGEGSSGVAGYLGAEAPRLEAKRYASRADWRKMNDFSRMCVAATRMATTDAGLKPSRAELDEIALVFATATGPLRDTVEFSSAARKGPDGAAPNLFPHAAVNGAAGHVCTVLGYHGPVLSFSQTGISSLIAFEYAAGIVRRGEVEVAIVLSADELCDATLGDAEELFEGRLTTDAVRPFDEKADGTAFGCAVVAIVLESAEHVAGRGGAPYAEVLGISNVGCALDAEDPATADAWRAALDLALERAGIERGAVDYYVAQACGIAAIDAPELAAIASDVAPVAVTAPKSMTGECMGSTAAVNVLVAALAVRDERLVGTANLDSPVACEGVEFVTQQTTRTVEYAVANAAAPGASYGAIVLGRQRS